MDGCKRKWKILEIELFPPLKSAEFVRHWAKFATQSQGNAFVLQTPKGKCANIAHRMRGTIIHIEDANSANAMESGRIHKFAMQQRNWLIINIIFEFSILKNTKYQL